VIIHVSIELQSIVSQSVSTSIIRTGVVSDMTARLQELVVGTNTMGSRVAHDINPADGVRVRVRVYLHSIDPS
jgi:hypothetical protein